MLVHTLKYAEMPKNTEAHYKNTHQHILQDYMHTHGMTCTHVCTYVRMSAHTYILYVYSQSTHIAHTKVGHCRIITVMRMVLDI